MGAEFRLLGPLEAALDGRSLALGGPKQRALLALLLLHANEVVPAERALDAIWPGADPSSAARSLQVYVSSLRKALGDAASALETRPGGYVLTVVAEDLDVLRFEKLAAHGRQALQEGNADHASVLLRHALALWRGPVLADLRYEDFAQGAVARLEELRLTTIEERIEADLALGRHAELTPELEGLVAEHPLRERLRRQLMVALYRSGRQADALAAFQDARRTLSEELGLQPGPELKELELAILRHDAALSVEPPELKARRRLPAPATALVGRRREVDEVAALLREARLVTLTGPGGTGKTRIAIQAAHELAADFAHGVDFVALAGVRDAALVVPEIALALGVQSGARSAADAVADHVRDRTLLLVVDNFEQVDAAAPEVGELLAAAPGLRLLVTSRHPLRLYGEHVFGVPPLIEDEAVALFVASARAVRRSFEPSAEVAQLCLLLDRLPLAIELAAARVGELTPGTMLTELPRRLELAVAGPRDAPARQRTLRAAVDWSFDLLDAASQTLFAQLAVFQGGCTVESAADVCEADPQLIRSLVEKSLLHEDGERRIMLETLREYALERLGDAGDELPTRTRHAEHFLALVLAGAELRGDVREWEWMDRLEADRENVRAAFGFWLEHDPERAARLADGAYRFWYNAGPLRRGPRRVRACRRARRASVPARPRARAQSDRRVRIRPPRARSRSGARRGGARRAAPTRRARRDLSGARAAGDDPERAGRSRGRYSRARGEHRGRAPSRRPGRAQLCALAPRSSGNVRGTVRASARARRRRAAGDAGRRRGESRFTVLGNLGIAALRTGHWAEAAERLAAALALADERSDPVGLLENIESIAAAAAGAGEPEPAARLLGAAEELEAARSIQLEAVYFAIRDDAIQSLRLELGEAALGAQHTEGRRLTLAEAVELAAAVAARVSGTAAPVSSRSCEAGAGSLRGDPRRRSVAGDALARGVSTLSP